MKPLILFPALLLTACATTTGAADNSYVQAREAGTVTGINEDGERVRCERVRETGSRFTQRICHTEREWEQIEENARQAAEDSQGRFPRDCGPRPNEPPQC